MASHGSGLHADFVENVVGADLLDADGNIHHFYNGSRVTDWDTVADGGCTYAVLAD